MIESVPGPHRKATMSATSSGSTRRFTAVRASRTSSSDLGLGDAVGGGLVGDLSLDEGGADVAGADGVAGDALAGALEGDHLGEPLEAVLGADVGGLVRRGAVPVDGGDVHDPAPAGGVHAGEQRPGQPERRLQHHPLDRREVLGVEVLDRRDVLEAGVVDQDVDVRTVEPRSSIAAAVAEVGDQVLAADLGGDLLGGGPRRGRGPGRARRPRPAGSATARPMPLAPPVTRAVRPVSVRGWVMLAEPTPLDVDRPMWPST